MKGLTALRRWLACFLLLAVAVLAIGMPAYMLTIDTQFWQKARGQEDDVTRAMRRIRPVHWGQVSDVHLGYLSDEPFWSYEWMLRYFRAQLVLVPHVLHPDPGNNRIILIDAADDAEANRLAAAHGLTHRERVAEGVIIAERPAP